MYARFAALIALSAAALTFAAAPANAQLLDLTSMAFSGTVQEVTLPWASGSDEPEPLPFEVGEPGAVEPIEPSFGSSTYVSFIDTSSAQNVHVQSVPPLEPGESWTDDAGNVYERSEDGESLTVGTPWCNDFRVRATWGGPGGATVSATSPGCSEPGEWTDDDVFAGSVVTYVDGCGGADDAMAALSQIRAAMPDATVDSMRMRVMGERWYLELRISDHPQRATAIPEALEGSITGASVQSRRVDMTWAGCGGSAR